MAKEEVARIINTRATFLTPPPIPGHIAVRLQPGANTVPAGYASELDKLDPKGRGKTWRQWVNLGWVKVETVKAGSPKVPDGPEAPASIADRRVEAAEAMVAVETERDTLRKWFASDRRDPIRTAITERLRQLDASPEAKA